jgi:tetratricopeptide (TPR) repeat protein
VEDLNQSEKEGGSAFVEGLKSGRWLFPIFIVGFALVSGVPRSWGNYYAKQVTSFRRAGDLQSAQESLDKAMLLAPTLPYVLSERALLLRAKNQPRRAFEVAEDLIRRHPRLPLGYVTKALLFQKSGQMADAEKMFLAAWKLAPRQGFSAFLMAILKEKTGLYQEAIVWLDREPQTGKMRWMIPTKKALLYIKLKQFTKATPMYRKALSWVPSKRRKCYVHRRVALAFFSVGANRKALAAIHRSMRIHPHEGINRLTRARIYYALGRQWAALRDVNAAIFRYGKGREDRALWTGRRRWTEAIFLRSNILISQHKYRRALRDVNLLIRMHPKKREYYHSRSLLWSKLGQKNKAASGLQGGTR